MTEFKVGDKVRIVDNKECGVVVHGLDIGAEVTVVKVDPGDHDLPYYVEGASSRGPLFEWVGPRHVEGATSAVEPGRTTVPEMADEDLEVAYHAMSDRVLQWQHLDATINEDLRALSELTGELNRRAAQRDLLTALSYVPIEKIAGVVVGQDLDLGNGLVVTRS
ncbi:hypothetical protein CLV30_106102 [Haloactinopolyspora alba]|uniref:Uncharacterized protein n=1 Tax=Haloactinopolyspora alba TaxID=648780 RepID=A0A2P8E3Q7_9ACTN|nr:hypothetical protein [Haloactinopolyspora alba]PSL04099.1 hypothetical protein CLV30_106102 [Haloactinopolyspora alba]